MDHKLLHSFIRRVIGGTVDHTGAYGPQSPDLVLEYALHLGAALPETGWHAKDLRTLKLPEPWQHVDRRMPGYAGDVVCFPGDGVVGMRGYGHTGVLLEDLGTDGVVIFHQGPESPASIELMPRVVDCFIRLGITAPPVTSTTRRISYERSLTLYEAAAYWDRDELRRAALAARA
jgi:hypothetical protein